MEENKKSKLGLGILIGVLVSLIIGLAGFIVYDKVLSEDNNKVENENASNNNNTGSENVTELSLSNTLVNSLSNIFYGKYLHSEATIYDNYFYKQSKTVVSNVPDELKMIMTFKYLNNPEKVSVAEYEKAYRQIFGSSSTPVKLNKTDDCDTNYELVNGYYQHPELSSCGGMGNGITYSKLIKAIQIKDTTTDKIVISEAVAFVNPSGSYKDVNYTQLIDANVDKNPLDKDYTKYAQYDYTFVKDANGIYVFTSVEKIK